MSVLGIRVDRTSCRALLVSEQGEMLGLARQDYVAPADGPRGSVLDPLMIWQAARTAITKSMLRAQTDRLRAVCITSTPDLLLPLAQSGQTLGSCLIAGNHPDESILANQAMPAPDMFQDLSGSVPGAKSMLAELCWHRANHPKRWDRIGKLAFVGGWVSYLLGGRMVADMSLASHTNLLDIAQEHWSGRLADRCGLSRFILPDLDHAGESLGLCAAGPSRQLELPENVRIVLGGEEMACAALGAGVLDSGAYLHLGSALTLIPSFQAVPLQSLMAQNGLGVWRHVTSSGLLSRVHDEAGGSVLQWLRSLLMPIRTGAQAGPSYNVIERFLNEMPQRPTQLMCLPGFGTSTARVEQGPYAGSILGLNLSTTRGELVKGLLEAMMYKLTRDIRTLQQVGISVQSLRCAGGGSRSESWLQLAADISGLVVERVAPTDPAPLGAAMLAAKGIGAYDNLAQAAQAMTRITARFEPDAQRHAIYEGKIEQYDELIRALATLDEPSHAFPIGPKPALPRAS